MVVVKLGLGRWRFTFSFAPVTKVVGVNSRLPDGQHILMWDFDDVDLKTVRDSLLIVQQQYLLPNIYILQTNDHNYIAYCFRAYPWRKAVEIIAATPFYDWNHFKYGIYRGYFTLRVTPKCGREPRLVEVLRSPQKEEVDVTQLRSWVEYETLPDNWPRTIFKLGRTRDGG